MRNIKLKFWRGCFALASTAVVIFGVSATRAFADTHDGCDVNAEDLPVSATVKGHMDSIGFVVGARWGEGVLTLPDGTERRFDIFGFKALETGVAATDFVGEVYNMNNIDDFPGTYYGAGTGITLVSGEGEAVANNARCVIIRAKADKAGVQLSAPAGAGIEISWDD